MNKFADLSDFIQQSLKNNVNIKVIALQEIWNIPYPELITIPNFHFVYKSRVNVRGGGVAFYVKTMCNLKYSKTFHTLSRKNLNV